MTLYWHALRQQAVSLLLWALGLAALCGTVVSSAGALRDQAMVDALIRSMPAAMRSLIGGDLMLQRPLDGFLYTKIFMYLPLLIAIYAAFQAAAMLAREAEQRRFDFLLSLPVTRRELLQERLNALLTGVAALWVITLLALLALLRGSGLQGDWQGYWLTAWSGFLVDALLSALALWASAGSSDYRRALRTGLAVAILPWGADLALRMAQAARGLRLLLPYGYYDPPHLLLTHAFPWLATVVLGLAAGIAAALALRSFQRREV